MHNVDLINHTYQHTHAETGTQDASKFQAWSSVQISIKLSAVQSK